MGLFLEILVFPLSAKQSEINGTASNMNVVLLHSHLSKVGPEGPTGLGRQMNFEPCSKQRRASEVCASFQHIAL